MSRYVMLLQRVCVCVHVRGDTPVLCKHCWCTGLAPELRSDVLELGSEVLELGGDELEISVEPDIQDDNSGCSVVQVGYLHIQYVFLCCDLVSIKYICIYLK